MVRSYFRLRQWLDLDHIFRFSITLYGKAERIGFGYNFAFKITRENRIFPIAESMSW